MFKTGKILKATKGKLVQGKRNFKFSSVSTNSKAIKRNELFIPLVGEKFDGHNFIDEAFKNGAAGTLTSKKIKVPKDKIVIRVKDTEKALQDIALFHRKKFNIPVIGITGSSGKTTTKDMLASILSQEKKTLKNIENYNNEIGVPLTLLKLDKTYKAAVVEMAMQGLGEILELAEIALPRFAIITNVGEAHIMQLRSRKNIAQAKAEILKPLNKKGIAILPSDDDFFGYLKAKAKRSKVISFGFLNEADIFPSNIIKNNHRVTFTVNYGSKHFKVTIPIPGLHNVYNALAAAAVAVTMGIKPRSVQKGLLKFRPSSKRMQMIRTKKGVRIINDTYNANPSSMKVALEALRDQGPIINKTPPRRIAILGDMLELGPKEKAYHEKTGRFAAEMGTDILITVGNKGKWIAKGAKKHGLKRVFPFKNNGSAAKMAKKLLRPNDVILAKASRAMHFEDLVEALRK